MKRPQDRIDADEVYFRTNVLLKSVIGRDLINDDNIAVLELVKNAYDAGAKSVDIHFSGLAATSQSRLVIRDDGKGMSEADVREKWLNIAYSEKRLVAPGSSRQFPMAGNKGVGRFSCDRLGETLDMFSRASHQPILHLKLDWRDFEIEDQSKEDIPIQKVAIKLSTLTDAEFTRLTQFEPLARGTILDIRRLRAPWTHPTLLSLRRSLARFVDPNQMFNKSGPRIQIEAPDFRAIDRKLPKEKRVNGGVANQVFSKLDFNATSIDSVIVDDGRLITTTLRHGGKEVYSLQERNERYDELRHIRITIYFLNQYKKAYFRRQTGQASIDFGSIFLFVNGFRIAPYGDRGDDWLQIDNRKQQQMQRHLGTRDIVGRVEIVDYHNRFRPVSSREGLVMNAAVFQLVDPERGFFQKAFKRLEKYVVDGLAWDMLSEQGKAELRVADGREKKALHLRERYAESDQQKSERVASQIHSILLAPPREIVSLKFDPAVVKSIAQQERASLERIVAGFKKYDPKVIDANLAKTLSRVREVLQTKERELVAAVSERNLLAHDVANKNALISNLEQREAQKEGQILFLTSIASGDLENVVLLHHQIGISSSTIDNYIESLTRALRRDGPLDRTMIANAIERISFENRKILAISRFATKANFRMDSQTITADIVPFVVGYLQNVSRHFVGSGLKVSVAAPDGLSFERKFKPIELTILLDNILSNAKKAGARALTVQLSKSGGRLELAFIDDGRGLPDFLKPAEYPKVFEKGFTTTDGSGLGLHHVQDIVKGMGGQVSAGRAPGRGAVITVTVPR